MNELRDHSERKHALLSPSAAYRWMNCTPAPRLEENFPDVESEAAKEGTLAHEICEAKLKNRLDIMAGNNVELEETWKSNELYLDEMEDFTDTYVNRVWSCYMDEKLKEPETDLYIELTFDLNDYIREGFGSADAVVANKNGINVFDFKYGKGVKVDAFENKQIMIYALGAYINLKNKYFKRLSLLLMNNVKVHMHIIQPRIYNFSDYNSTMYDLILWSDDLRNISEIAYKGEGEQKAGDWCLFCKAKGRCAKLMEMASQERKTAGLMSNEELSKSLNTIPLLRGWADAVEKEALNSMLEGTHVRGYKLVNSRTRRKITDEAQLGLKLDAAGYGTDDYGQWKIKSITELEKLCGKSEFAILSDGCMGTTESHPEIAKEDDKRPAITDAEIDYGFINNKTK